MRIVRSITVTSGALAAALILSVASPPAKAGPACNRIGLNSPCIMSNDLKARINLRESGRDGRLQIRDADNETAVTLDGNSANVTNLFSNEAGVSNGLVKAWAQINADGTIAACWRCNTDPSETRRLSTGGYKVDFTPLATDIRGRPRSANSNGAFGAGSEQAVILLDDHFADASSVFAELFAPAAGLNINAPFVLIIY